MTELRASARLVALLTLGVGALLVVVGSTRTYYLLRQSQYGVETVATIDAGQTFAMGSGGTVDLRWQDASGATRQALGVEVTRDLGRKLRLGGVLMRSELKIRYQPEATRSAVLVVEDLPEKIRRTSTIAIAGFVALTGGSLLMLWLAIARGARPDGAP